ncbi:UTP--glucose-1-phosphate uridylyltransferase [bacterium]|nr:UTP--glucose-1-phosphate uridylyltransferase [candidate division CSSED10-310 bacterium]
MRDAGIHPRTIASFRRYYRQLVSGETGLIPETDLIPVDRLPRFEELGRYEMAGCAALAHTVVIKLNGGLGTSMGMNRAKSLVEVKNGASFLEIICRRILHLRSRYGMTIPLILMNSDHTRTDSIDTLNRYTALPVPGVPLDFLQNRVPKIRQADLLPASCPENEDLEWNPPGHGDIYNALVISGCLDTLLKNGYHTAFISNADNLGAELDPIILGFFISEHLTFLMEVAIRTDADRKGGHLARTRDGRLMLREIAQCCESDHPNFFDIRKHRYFNTNSIWIDLHHIHRMMDPADAFIDLPMIRNAKTLNPRDPGSIPVYQIETAMGAAISRFPRTGAIHVPRSRFLPVKTTNDLAGLRSDAYCLTADDRIVLDTDRTEGVITELDNRFYRILDDLTLRFPWGMPSLKDCETWSVIGDVRFGRAIRLQGSVRIINETGEPRSIPDGSVLNGTIRL